MGTIVLAASLPNNIQYTHMHELTDDERKQVLGEVLMDELKAIREGISALPTRIEFIELKDDVTELKTDVKAIKAAVKNYSQEQTKLDNRVTLLEQAA